MKAKARKFRGYSPVRAAKGFGPRHAENAKEGDLTKVNTDTVPAMLTPREAILNRNAAEMAGRGNIEKLNAEGNKLARKGVDLAAEGDEDVPYPMRLPYEGAQAAQAETAQRNADLLQELEDKLRARGVPPLRGLSEGEESKDTGHQVEGQRILAAKGTSDMKEKAKKMQGGAAQVPGQKSPMYNSIGGMPGTYGPSGPVGSGSASGGLPGSYGQSGPVGPGSAQGGLPGMYGGGGGMPGMPPDRRYLGPPVHGGGGMPGMYGGMPHTQPGHWGPMPARRGGGGGFYPPRGGHPMGMQGGSEEVQGPIGSPNPQTAYGPPIQLSAPDITRFLQQAGQQQGLSAGQIAGLAKAFQGFGSGYNELTGGAGGDAGSYFATSGDAMNSAMGQLGYQGGISDIGYPPFVAPGAEYHADKGGWLGPYDPAYTYNSYARGIASVPFR